MKRLIVGLAAFLLALSPSDHSFSQSQKNQPPRFQDYPAEVWAGKATLLDIRSHALARTYRTRLREALREEGINFAGHYTFTSIGCGASCSINAIVDARTGKAYFPNALSAWTDIIGGFDKEDLYEERTRADSRLLRILGRPNIGRMRGERYGPSGIYYYQWTNGHLRLIRFVPAGSYPKADPLRIKPRRNR